MNLPLIPTDLLHAHIIPATLQYDPLNHNLRGRLRRVCKAWRDVIDARYSLSDFWSLPRTLWPMLSPYHDNREQGECLRQLWRLAFHVRPQYFHVVRSRPRRAGGSRKTELAIFMATLLLCKPTPRISLHAACRRSGLLLLDELVELLGLKTFDSSKCVCQTTPNSVGSCWQIAIGDVDGPHFIVTDHDVVDTTIKNCKTSHFISIETW